MPAADTARLIAELSLKDNLSKGVGTALKSVDKLEGRLGRIGAHAQRGVQNAARNLTTLGVVAGGFVATQVYAGVRSLEDLERVSNLTAGVIKSTGGAAGVTAQEVRKMAEALEEVTTADDKLIQEGQNMLLTFTNIGETVFPKATKAVVDLGIAMADGDVAAADFSASAIQIGKALNDPIRGITALRRVGVAFTKEQEKQIKTLVESGKVTEAQTLILNELEKEFGEAGRAAGKGFGADMRRFEDAVEGGQQALARGFLPLISRVSRELQTQLARPEVLQGIEDFGNTLADGFGSAVDFAKRIPWAQVGDAMRLAGTGAKLILDAFTGLPPWVQTAVITGWGLNKLTGGALGSIVGELGKGLVKGVLGMNAGVVNINAASVTGAGGVPGAAGKAGGGLGALVVPAAAVAAIAGAVALGFEKAAQNDRNVATGEALSQQGRDFGASATLAQLLESQRGVEQYVQKLSTELTPEGIAYGLDIDGVKTRLDGVQAQLAADIAAQRAAAQINMDAGLAAQRTGERLQGLENETKAAVLTGLAEHRAGERGDLQVLGSTTSAAVQAAQSVISSATTQAGSFVSGAVRSGTSAITSAIRAIPAPITNVIVNVTATKVTQSVTKQDRSGPSGGSRSHGGPGMVPV